MIELARAIDNPIFLKSVFSRLRFPGAWVGMIVMGVLCMFALGAAVMTASAGPRGNLTDTMTSAFGFIYGMQCFMLFLLGTSAVAGGIAQERESGVFDMMRMAPQSPLRMVAGYILGMPFREHMLVLVMMPFAGIAGLVSRVPIQCILSLYVVMYVDAIFYHTLAAVLAMVVKRPRSAAGLSIGLVLGYHFFSLFSFNLFTVYPLVQWAFNDSNQNTSQFFGLSIFTPLYLVGLVSFVAVFLWMAAVRKFRSEERPALSKGQALAFYGLVQIILLGSYYDTLSGSYSYTGRHAFMPGSEFGYWWVSLLSALVAVGMGTPSAAEYGRSVRRAQKQNRAALGRFEDGTLNTIYTSLLILAFPLAMAVAAKGTQAPVVLLFIGGSSVFLFAAMMQWIKLKFGRRWISMWALALFIAWFVPILLAILASFRNASEEAMLFVGGFFPFLGLALGLAGGYMKTVVVISIVNTIAAGTFASLGYGQSREFWKVQPKRRLATAARHSE